VLPSPNLAPRILLLVALCSSVLAAQTRPEVYKILGISVEGLGSAEQQAVLATTGLKAGDEINVPGDETRTAIQRLYQLKLFDDIQILIERRVQDGVYLLIRVTENPRLEALEIVGNDELSESDVRKQFTLTKGQLLMRHELARMSKLLEGEYAKEGYLNATVRTELVASADTLSRRKILKVIIEEGPKVKVDQIEFHGNVAFDDGDLKGAMGEISERRWWKFWATNKFDQKKYEEDKKLIVGFYRKNGYRDAEILRDSLSYDASKRYLRIELWVNEGPQYKIRNITWEGNTKYKAEFLNARLGFVHGDIYDKEKFNENLYRSKDESDVASLYYDNGYLLFNVEPDEIRVGEDSLDIVLRVRERNQFRIGRVLVSGNTKTYEKVIRRELHTRPGDYFSKAAIMRSVRQLAQLNYFNPEKIRPDYRIVDEKNVDLEYGVEEKSSDTFNMSVGYSGFFGFNGGFGLTFNNFSISEPFRGGGGQVLNFEWQFGEGNRYRTFTIGFQEPWMFDTPTLFGFNISDTRVLYFDVDYRVTGASVRIGRRLKWPDYLFRGDWTVRYQRTDVVSAGDFYRPGVTTQLGVAQVISRNSTDSPIFPTIGSSFSLLTEVNGGPFLPGSARFHKHVFNADWFIPIFGNQRIALALSTTFGFIFGFEENSPIPYQDYFYMGGTGLGQFSTTPLRGYEDRSIGSRTPGNNIIGGKGLIKHSAELRFALAINPIPIYTLLFAEAGNTWGETKLIDPLDLKRSAGLGLRLLINPIGLVGFDYGYGFDSTTPFAPASGWKFHFQFGRGF